MKLDILKPNNSKDGSVEFPISEPLREDVIKRAVLALQSKSRQPYGADPRAGLKYSADLSRRRRKYRGSYGKGISRVPRKILSRRGLNFYMVGAEVPGTVGGRRAHPPKATKKWVHKINKKENRKAINSAMTAAMNKDLVQQRGHIVPDTYPFALSKDFEALNKTAEVRKALLGLGFANELARGENGARSLLIVTESEPFALAARNIAGIDAISSAQLNAEFLAPGTHPGRATLFTAESVNKLSEKPVQAPKKVTKSPAKKTTKKTVKKSTKKVASKQEAKK